MKRPPYKLLYIEWIDSSIASESWEKVGTLEDPDMICVSTGYLIDENKSTVTIAPHLAPIGKDDWQACGTMWIPKVAIKKKRVVRI